MHSRPAAILLLLAIALGGVACSKSATGDAAESQIKQYTDALQALIDGNYLDATTKFEDLANKTLDQAMQENSTIRLGDTLFYQGRYREAAEIYREYLTQRDDSPMPPTLLT